jgi:hypothetical protein
MSEHTLTSQASRILQVATNSCMPDVKTLPDDDPSVSSSEETLPSTDDDSSLDGFDQERESIGILSPLNSIEIPVATITHSNDVEDGESIANPEPGAPPLDDSDDDVPRAQIDTGAFASCTDQLHLLHHYRPFTTDFPCPVKLQPATEGSDAIPHGVWYLHVPAEHPSGFLAVRTFYHPDLRTTVIDERDFAKAAGHRIKDIQSEVIYKFHGAGTFTYKATHKLKASNDVIVHGVLNHGKCYTAGLIPPCDSDADSSPVLALKTSDPDFLLIVRRLPCSTSLPTRSLSYLS